MTDTQLAVNGGPRSVTSRYRDNWRRWRVQDMLPLLKYLRCGWQETTMGKGLIAEFESAFADNVGLPHALAMNSGTAALHSALFAVGVGPGDEVILPSYTWHASASAILCCGAKPVFCDLDPQTLTADPRDIKRRITSKTKAIMAVHIWGNPSQLDAISDIAREAGIKLVEDCSHAHGASYKGKAVGAWGDIGCFSLQGSKAVSTGEGGIAVCSNPVYYDRMLALGHPVRISHSQKQKSFDLGLMNLGPKYRPSFPGLLLGAMTLKRLDRLNELRRRNWKIICEELSDCPEMIVPATLPGAERGGFLEFKIILDDEKLVRRRDDFVNAAQAEGVLVSADRYGSLHKAYIYQQGGPLTIKTLERPPKEETAASLPATDRMQNRVITLPAFVDVSECFVRQCVKGLRKVASAFLQTK